MRVDDDVADVLQPIRVLLAFAGAAHFKNPEFFDEIVPHALPGTPRSWTYVSGVAELACAVAVANPRTRRLGGLAAAALFVAVFPANIQMAVDWRSRAARERTVPPINLKSDISHSILQ